MQRENTSLLENQAPPAAIPEIATSNLAHIYHDTISSATPVDLFSWLAKYIVPLPLFAAAMAAFTACCLIGYSTTRHNLFQGFQHFNPGMGPQTQFYPTLAELSAFVNDQARTDQTIVVVGGNSIFNGVGQPTWQLWTKNLQEILGPRYAVVNLAFQGAPPFSASYITFESLAKQRGNKRILFVTNTIRPGQCETYMLTPYSYAFFDAWNKNQLLPSPERDAMLKRDQSYLPLKQRDELNELKLRLQLERCFYFCDFWNSVGFRKFFTFWDPVAAQSMNPFGARKHFPDMPLIPRPVEVRFADSVFHTKVIRDSMKGLLVKDANGEWVEDAKYWKSFAEQASAVVPAALKERVLVVSTFD
ncbi:MAG TPA: hypothetical protein V6C72_18655, partial [Chroococcales cyanobacterium]